MCLNRCKNCGFREISLFALIHEFGVLGRGFRCHFGVCWLPWEHFFSFVRVLERGLKFDDFPWMPLEAQSLNDEEVGGKKHDPGAQKTD